MQLTAKLKNKATPWTALLKVRALDMVVNAGVYYQNISGINGSLTDPTHWYPWPQSDGSSTVRLNKNASNIAGTDPDFHIDLSSDGLPAFPGVVSVYVSLTGLSTDYKPAAANYDPVGLLLHGMSDPAAFPAQLVKIVVM